MAQIAKTEAKAEIQCAPAKIYDFFKHNICQLVNMFPQIFKSVQLIEGEEGQVGNVKLAEYVLGKAMTAKFKTEELNDEEKSITFRVLEGEIRQMYSSFAVKVTSTDGSVNCSFEFEKINELVPNPDNYATVAVQVTKGLDLYFLTH